MNKKFEEYEEWGMTVGAIERDERNEMNRNWVKIVDAIGG